MDEYTSIFRDAGILLEPPSPSPRSRGLSPFELKLKESGMVQESREDQDRWAPQQNIPIDGPIQHQHTHRGVDRTHALEDVVSRASDGGGSLALGRIVRDSGKVSAGKALRRTKGVIVSRRVDPQAPQQDQIAPSRTRSRSHLQQKSFELELSPIIEDTRMFCPTLAFGATTNTTNTTNNDADASILVSDTNFSSDDSDEFIDTSLSKFKPQRPVFLNLSNTHPHGTAAPEIPALTLTIPTPELRNTLMFQPPYSDGDATQSQLQLSSDPRALAPPPQVDDSDPRPNALELEYSRGRPGAPSPGLGIGVRVDGVAELGTRLAEGQRIPGKQDLEEGTVVGF
ncbi:hypothetical protein BD779DRAFT_286828 [Infundibulicybe gibba]|nr:hypothetical protein BD779DRAFT_286828 [Infundibulicybe gibba]